MTMADSHRRVASFLMLGVVLSCLVYVIFVSSQRCTAEAKPVVVEFDNGP